jgi:hypothetical protein
VPYYYFERDSREQSIDNGREGVEDDHRTPTVFLFSPPHVDLAYQSWHKGSGTTLLTTRPAPDVFIPSNIPRMNRQAHRPLACSMRIAHQSRSNMKHTFLHPMVANVMTPKQKTFTEKIYSLANLSLCGSVLSYFAGRKPLAQPGLRENSQHGPEKDCRVKEYLIR